DCLVIEPHFDGRLDDGEIGGNIEIARAIKGAVADMIDFPACFCAFYPFDRGQNRITDRVEGLRYERRAYKLGWIARAERNHAPPETLRYRERHQIAAQIDDILEIVLQADAFGRVFTHCPTIAGCETNRPADTRVIFKIGRDGYGDDSRFQVGFNEIAGLTFRCCLALDWPDVKCRM